MPRKTHDLLERIQVKTPCDADWDSMTGDDRVRFCTHCERHVNDLSRMTRAEALRLVSRSGGRLCVRYVRLPDGRLVTADARPAPLYRIARRASRIAAGAAAAAISLSAGAAAQAQSSAGGATLGRAQFFQQAGAQRTAAGPQTATLAGTVLDPQGAVVVGARVTATQAGSGESRSAVTDDAGAFSLSDLAPGVYRVEVSASGFMRTELTEVAVQAGGTQRVDVPLQAAVIRETMGVVAIAMPTDPLVKAAYENDLGKVERLLARGANPDALDRGIDSTALMQAVGHANMKMIKRLLDAGADVNAENRAGSTALMSLSDQTTPEVVRALVEAGAQVNVRDDAGNAALVSAALACGPEVIRRLIDAGAKLNARNDDGRTALMLAAEAGALEAVKLLIAAGADINLKDDEGRTALNLAKEGQHTELANYLIAHGAVEGKAEADEGEEEEEEQPFELE